MSNDGDKKPEQKKMAIPPRAIPRVKNYISGIKAVERDLMSYISGIAVSMGLPDVVNFNAQTMEIMYTEEKNGPELREPSTVREPAV